MNKPLTAAIIILISFHLGASAQSISKYFRSIKSFTVQPVANSTFSEKIPFSKIVVQDYRFDTTKAGFVRTGYNYKKLVTKKSVSRDLETFLNKHYASNLDKESHYTLLFVIKHLWLQETSDAEESDAKIAMQSDFLKNYSRCNATIEVYAKDAQTYIPLFKLDTVLNKDRKLTKVASHFISQPFEYCMEKLRSKKVDRMIYARRKVDETEFVSYQNRNRINIPSRPTTKGIYMTFKDFVNNTPVTQPFEVKTGLTDDLYLVENGNERAVEKFWGFCDGERLFVRIDYSFFELCKEGQTYSFWGSKGIVHHYNPLWISSNANNTRTSKMDKTMRPMQLNMETGKVY